MTIRQTALAIICFSMAGCALFFGGDRVPITLLSPPFAVATSPDWPKVSWQLSLAKPVARQMIDTQRIIVRPTPGELQYYRGGSWVTSTTDMTLDAILQTFEDSQCIDAVARQGTGINADYKLIMDIRRFEADFTQSDGPVMRIEMQAKLLDNHDQSVVSSQTFLVQQPTPKSDLNAVNQAFGEALSQLSAQVVGWTLHHGQQDYQRHRP